MNVIDTSTRLAGGIVRLPKAEFEIGGIRAQFQPEKRGRKPRIYVAIVVGIADKDAEITQEGVEVAMAELGWNLGEDDVPAAAEAQP